MANNKTMIIMEETKYNSNVYCLVAKLFQKYQLFRIFAVILQNFGARLAFSRTLEKTWSLWQFETMIMLSRVCLPILDHFFDEINCLCLKERHGMNRV